MCSPDTPVSFNNLATVVNSACAWWRSNCCASCSCHQVHAVVCVCTKKQASSQIQTKSGRSEPSWSLTTDDWSGCVHVAGTLSDSEEEEAVGTHATVVSSDVEEHNAGYQSGVGVLRRSADVQGQMALKDAFNQELYGSRTNGGRGLLGRRRPNCFSWPRPAQERAPDSPR